MTRLVACCMPRCVALATLRRTCRGSCGFTTASATRSSGKARMSLRWKSPRSCAPVGPQCHSLTLEYLRVPWSTLDRARTRASPRPPSRRTLSLACALHSNRSNSGLGVRCGLRALHSIVVCRLLHLAPIRPPPPLHAVRRSECATPSGRSGRSAASPACKKRTSSGSRHRCTPALRLYSDYIRTPTAHVACRIVGAMLHVLCQVPL